jgi:hypothetical protein
MTDSDPPLPTKPTPPVRESAKARRRMILIIVAPLVSVATLMLGLRVGAGNTVHSATVFAAPPGRAPTAGAPVPFTWQILTYLEDRGVRETIGGVRLEVLARSKGHEARWSGTSNEDGIAEAVLALPDFATNDPVDLEVRTPGEARPLAEGRVEWKDVPWGRDREDADNHTSARPSKREGAIGIDVFVEGDRLVVGFDTPVWAHLVAPAPLDASLRVTPESALRVLSEEPKVGCDGWAEIAAVAEGHVAGMQLDAKSKDGRTGVWFGALPVAPGAFFVGAPRFVPAGRPETAVLVAPNPRTVVYAEIDDERGRVFAAALPVKSDPGDPVPRAHLPIPVLAPGLHWLVVSGEPRGAEHLAGAAIAKPFLVGGADGVRPNEACSVGPWLARRPPVLGFRRWLALDGMATRGAKNRASRQLGLAIGLGSLLVAAILEVLLLTAASREAREALFVAAEGEDDERERVTRKAPGGGLAIALLVAMLGFALLAALMIAKA